MELEICLFLPGLNLAFTTSINTDKTALHTQTTTASKKTHPDATEQIPKHDH